MCVIEDRTFSADHPETYPWGHVKNGGLASAASTIAGVIEHIQRMRLDEELLPGLRQSLEIIAIVAEI